MFILKFYYFWKKNELCKINCRHLIIMTSGFDKVSQGSRCFLLGLLLLYFLHIVIFGFYQLRPLWRFPLHVYQNQAIYPRIHRRFNTSFVHRLSSNILWAPRYIDLSGLYSGMFKFRSSCAFHSCTNSSWLFHHDCIFQSSNHPSSHPQSDPTH